MEYSILFCFAFLLHGGVIAQDTTEINSITSKGARYDGDYYLGTEIFESIDAFKDRDRDFHSIMTAYILIERDSSSSHCAIVTKNILRCYLKIFLRN